MAPAMAKKKRPAIAKSASNAIAQYFQSKNTEKSIKHYPEWDVVKSEPMLELMRVHRELLIADADLEEKHVEYYHRKEMADRQWQDLRTKERLLRRSFFKFDDFVKVNREKRDRAQRKIRDEKERQKIRVAEIKELEVNLSFMEKVRDKMKQFVELYKPYQKYLENVVETNQFQTIAEIFNRYETLVDARLSLQKSQEESLCKLEDTTSQLERMAENKAQSLMDLKSRLAELQSKLERARTQAMRWEFVISRVKEVASRKELEDAQIQASIWNLYRKICWRKGVPVEAKRDELERQLLHTKRTIVQLVKIVQIAKRKARQVIREKDHDHQDGETIKPTDTRTSLVTGSSSTDF